MILNETEKCIKPKEHIKFFFKENTYLKLFALFKICSYSGAFTALKIIE